MQGRVTMTAASPPRAPLGSNEDRSFDKAYDAAVQPDVCASPLRS